MTVAARPVQPASSWVLPGAWRERGVHRLSRRAAFVQLVVNMVGTVRTMASEARKIVWSLGWMAAFTGAGFTINLTVGLVVLGLALFFMDLRTGE